jgi:hypothetical protein
VRVVVSAVKIFLRFGQFLCFRGKFKMSHSRKKKITNISVFYDDSEEHEC